MRILFFLVLLVIVPVTVIVGIIYVIARALARIVFNPESKAWVNLLERLRSQLRQQKTQLVPWDAEMLSLLSFNQVEQKKPGLFGGLTSGILTTIYQEPVLAYVQHVQGKTSVVLARTSDREFVFRQKEKETEIWVNGQLFAVLAQGTLLASGKNSRLIGRLEGDREEALLPITIGDRTAAALTNPRRATGPNPRVLGLLRSLTPEEEVAVLALALTQLPRQ